jgi:hypothetical protein
MLGLVIPALLLTAFVTGIDPYYVFGAPGWQGINAVRPFYEPHVVIAKPYQVRRLRPNAVALGSSRAEIGIDPRHRGWGAANVFNFAMPASTSYDVLLAFAHAQAVGRPLKQAVLGLDFFGFNIFMTRNQDQMEQRFAGDGVMAFADFLDDELKKRRPDPLSVPTGKDEAIPLAFNEALYLATNGDVAAAVARNDFASGRQHYELAGQAEHRQGATIPADWDENGYLQVNPDVADAVSRRNFLNGYHHYLVAGRVEGRLGGFQPTNWDERSYLAANPDARIQIALGVYRNGYLHYAARGRAQGLIGGFPPSGLFDRLRLRWPSMGNAMFQLTELWQMIFSTTAVSEAFATIFHQSEPASFNSDGVRVWQGQDAVLRRLGGTGQLTRTRLLGGSWAPELSLPKLMYCFSNMQTGMTMFDPFRFVVRRAYAEGTDLRLFATPLQALIRDLFRGLDLSTRYDFWLKELVRINEEEAARAGKPPLPLWDFSDPNSITLEMVPMAGDSTPMHWFWESSHYRQITGDLILDRIFSYTDPSRRVPDDFGVRLTSANIDSHIASSNAKLAVWATGNELAIKLGGVARRPHELNRQSEATCW